MDTLIWFIPLPPLLAFFAIVLYTRNRNALSHSIAVGAAAISWLLGMIAFVYAITREELALHPIGSAINWLPLGTGWLQIGVRIDPLSAVTLFFVAWTVLMIFIYSIGYHNFGQPKGEHDKPGLPPHGATVRIRKGQSRQVMSIEPMYSRFFALISLFAFAMLVLVVSDNLLTLYIGWEIMGFCSYALIGFWYAKESARDAGVKAFLTTRVGDVFMLLGLVALYSQTGTLSYAGTLYNPEVLSGLAASASGFFDLSWAGLIAILLFTGVVGKSAQFPLHVWLPDAMEGPTPVSAMIHAATMVSAGVYLALRIFPLASAGWTPGEPITAAMTAMAAVGAFTALFAAVIAVAQNDIKRVLAYSTISQLGYMIAALGVGAYAAAAFHLFTHAFFKALLFLGSGSVIHGMEHGVLHTGEHIDPQDMRNMGGLKDRMPRTFWTFLAGGMALSGLPLITAGFWSKDEILAGAFNSNHLVVFLTLALAALLTAFYTTRQIVLTFLGTPRTRAAEHAHETSPLMTIPLIVLAVFAVAAGWVGIPHSFPGLGAVVPNLFEEFLMPMLEVDGHAAEAAAHTSLVPLFTSILVSLGGIALGYVVYRGFTQNAEDPLRRPLGAFYRWAQDRFYLDEVYNRLLVEPSRWFSDEFTYRFVDRKIIDGILEGVARATLWIGVFLRRYIDVAVVNRAGDSSGLGVRGLGASLRPVQTGRVQQYMLMAVLLTVVASVILIYFLVVV
jgi:NADH-quinone oxidoreductase subunit L